VLELATKLRLFDETMQHGRVVGVPLVQELDRHVAAEVKRLKDLAKLADDEE